MTAMASNIMADGRQAASKVQAMVELRGLSLEIGGQSILKNVDLSLPRGQTTAIIGPSGSGKTTLLRCINYLARPTAGEIWVDGQLIGQKPGKNGFRPVSERVLRAHRRQTGMVFQQFNLFRNMTVLENVMFAPLASKQGSRAEIEQRATLLIARVGLAHKHDAYPSQLSGGQQQRIAIARALAMEPKVMLFDEATSALDPELAREVLEVMREMAEEGMTMIVVTHEMGFAREVAQQIVFMEQGEVIAMAAPDQLFSASAPERIRQFLKI